jgi:DNA polymerase-3 subunit gamma/tau
MVLIRLAHAGSLPSPEEAARRIAGLQNGEISAPQPRSGGNGGAAPVSQSAPVETRGFEQPSPPRPQGGPTAMLRPVPDMRPAEMPAPPKAEPQPEAKIHIRSLADIANLAGENRDMKLKAQLRQFVRPVRIEPGKLEIALSPDAPKSVANDLFVRLKEWTGVTWQVSVSQGPGGLTLVEEEAQQRERNFDAARADPDVAAILSRFPGARVVNVVVHSDPQSDDESDAPANLETPDEDD